MSKTELSNVSPRESSSLDLSIPDAQHLREARTSRYRQRQAELTELQKQQIEQAFNELPEGEDTINFETSEPLTRELVKALRDKGYSYSYSYKYINGEHSKCIVTISSQPLSWSRQDYHDFHRSFTILDDMLYDMFKNISVPLLGAGIYGCDKQLVADALIEASDQFLTDYSSRYLKSINVVVIEPEDLELF